MAFTLETGAGVAGANAFVAVATVTTLLTDRGEVTAWTALSSTEKEQAVVRATDYIRLNPRYRWTGTRKTYAQGLPWPRVDAVERDGQIIANNVVPWQVEHATAFLAARMTDPGDLAVELPDLERGGRFTSESFINGLYSYTAEPGSTIGTTIQYIDGLLAPLLRSGSDPWDTIEMYQVLPELPDVLRASTYSEYTADANEATED